jgi:hypothetical protein
MRLKSLLFLSSLALLLAAAPARAGLSFSLSPSVKSGTGSNEIVFTGTLINTSLTTNLFLNGVQLTFTNAATNFLAANTNAYFANVPGVLLPGEIYSDVVFAVGLNPAATNGDYAGIVTIQGGTNNIFATANLASQPFHVSMTPAALGITRSRTNFILKWPAPPAGFVLQQNTNVATTNWLAVTNVPGITNGLNQVILSSTNARQFYRLKYP